MVFQYVIVTPFLMAICYNTSYKLMLFKCYVPKPQVRVFLKSGKIWKNLATKNREHQKKLIGVLKEGPSGLKFWLQFAIANL